MAWDVYCNDTSEMFEVLMTIENLEGIATAIDTPFADLQAAAINHISHPTVKQG